MIFFFIKFGQNWIFFHLIEGCWAFILTVFHLSGCSEAPLGGSLPAADSLWRPPQTILQGERAPPPRLKHNVSILFPLLSCIISLRHGSSRIFTTLTKVSRFRLETTGACLPRPSPGTPTPPRFTALGPRACRWVTGNGPPPWWGASGPAGFPAWGCTRWTAPRHSRCWGGKLSGPFTQRGQKGGAQSGRK